MMRTKLDSGITTTSGNHKKLFLRGIRDGLPIGAGYFAVSFSVGIMAKQMSLTPIQGFVMSLLTNASAGEYAGLVVISENSGYFTMMLMTLVASCRYFLMSCAYSQRLDPKMPFYHRFFLAFDLTDEIFGAAIARPGNIKPPYVYGTYILPLIGWSTGTLLGILMGTLLPSTVVSALSVSLFGMFIAIIVPPARKSKPVLIGVLAGFLLSFACSRLPVISELSEGLRTILLTVLIAGVLALVFPVKEEEEAAEV